MNRIYNFSAGPSMLPLPVLERAASELVCYGDSGMSVMEMSHRSKAYDAIIKEAEQDIRDLMKIPDNYKVMFFTLIIVVLQNYERTGKYGIILD